VEWSGDRSLLYFLKVGVTGSGSGLEVRFGLVFGCSFVVRSFVRRSFLRSFVPSFLRSFVPSFLRSFVPSFLRSFVPSFLRSFFFLPVAAVYLSLFLLIIVFV